MKKANWLNKVMQSRRAIWPLAVFFLVVPSSAFAAIAFDAETQGSAGGTGALTLSHTITGADPFLVGVVQTDDVSSFTATWNGTSMTQIESASDGAGNEIYMFYLAAPSTGTHDLVYTKTGSGSARGFALSYTGVDQSTPLDAHTFHSAGTGSTHTSTITVVGANTWLVGGVASDGGAPSAGTGTTQRGTNVGFSGVADSNGTVGTGSQALEWTGSQPWESVIISITPSAGGGGGGGGGGDSATSTIEQSQQNLGVAFILFFVSFFGMLWMLRKH